MKPLTRQVGRTSDNFQSIPITPIVGSVVGHVELDKLNYAHCTIVLVNKANMNPIRVTKPNEDGTYSFNDLNTNLQCILYTLDDKKEYEAVIQDYIVPK